MEGVGVVHEEPWGDGSKCGQVYSFDCTRKPSGSERFKGCSLVMVYSDLSCKHP